MTSSQNGADILLVDDRRQTIDRRLQVNKAAFPLIDSEGRYIKADRRNSPDRRLANIQVKELALNGEMFENLFSK